MRWSARSRAVLENNVTDRPRCIQRGFSMYIDEKGGANHVKL